MIVKLNINGTDYEASIDPRQSLLDVIRDVLHLTGTKRSCGEGYCGACTVLLDRKPVNSCLILAAEAQGRPIVTIEGVEANPKWRKLQEIMIRNSAPQCGYCMAGTVMNVIGIVEEDPDISPEELKRALAGNLCRCGSHHNVIRSVGEYQAELD